LHRSSTDSSITFIWISIHKYPVIIENSVVVGLTEQLFWDITQVRSINYNYGTMRMTFIFDFDGVLAHSLPQMLKFAGQACSELGHPRQPTPDDLEALERMEFSELGRRLGLPDEKIGAFVQRCFDLFNAMQEPLPIFAGMRETLLRLSEMAGIAIITGNSQKTVRRFLRVHQLAGVVDLISGAEEPGGRADKIRAVVAELHGSLDRTYMIGDAVSDVRAARQAGVKSIAVCWGHQSKEKLIAEKPDHIAETPEDLLRLAEELPDEVMID